MDVKFKKINIIALSLLLLIPVGCGSVAQKVSLEEQFSNPRPGETDPWTFWYWMYGAVSKEGITADLEAMHDIGLGGAYLMPIRSNAENKNLNMLRLTISLPRMVGTGPLFHGGGRQVGTENGNAHL